VLASGNVMIIGGNGDSGTYEIRTQEGVLVKNGFLQQARNGGAGALRLGNGNVFLLGSDTSFFGSPGTWEILDQNGNLVAGGNLLNSRGGASASMQSTGNVFLAGGEPAPDAWEIRSPSGALVSSGSLFNTRRPGHSHTHF
jgi:hypothetical protein